MPHSKASGGDLIWRPTRLAIYARDQFCCAVCGWEPKQVARLLSAVDSLRSGASVRPIDGKKATRGLSIDHVRPPSMGGANGPGNLVTLCVWCNSAKQHNQLRAWMRASTLANQETEIVARVRRLTRRKLDRALGRLLVDTCYSGWLEKQNRRRLDLKKRKAQGATESAKDFFERLTKAA